MDRNARRLWLPACVAGIAALAACTDEPVLQALPLDPGSSVTGLRITPDSALLSWLGATTQLEAELVNARGDVVVPPRIYWSSSDPAVAAVDSTGTVLGVGVGTAQVVAGFLELADTATVRVARVPVSMTLAPDTVLLTGLAQAVDLHAFVLDGASQPIGDAKVSWSSSRYGVALVGDGGRVVAMGDGLATITARVDTLVRSARVRVSTRATTMAVTPAQIRLDGVSDTARVVAVVRNAAGIAMHPPQPVFTSSDTTVATVDFIGFVIARKSGSATLTVVADTLHATVPVTVTQTVAEVRIAPDTATLSVGGTKAYAVVVRDRFGITVPGATVAWSSSDSAVATVSATGLVTGLAPGTATLTAASGGRSDTARVTVR
ncbi:MAG: Ig-like domain-containing protein [Longimicrobiales bacterium]